MKIGSSNSPPNIFNHLFPHNTSNTRSICALTMDNDLACAQYVVITQPPTLTAGKITPKALMLFEQNCLDYFINAKGGVADNLKVPRILSSFKDIEVLDWIASDRERLQGITFPAFMTELRRNFLPLDWEETICSEILSSKLTSNKSFQDWARIQVINNCVLQGTTSHFSNNNLQNTLEANHCETKQVGKLHS